jgi:hypothetical protein
LLDGAKKWPCPLGGESELSDRSRVVCCGSICRDIFNLFNAVHLKEG